MTETDADSSADDHAGSGGGTRPPSDPQEFVRLLTQSQRRVYAFVLAMVPNWADADEILQETNVRLWDEFARYSPGTDFGAWACTVARYQVLTFRKRQSRERVRFTDAFLDVVAEEWAAGDDDAADRHVALEQCVNQLAPVNRDLLRAYYRPGADAAAVADGAGRSVEALYKALSRIRRFLHDCIRRRLDVRTG